MALNTTGFRKPRLRLQRPRPRESLTLDSHLDEAGLNAIPYLPWEKFLEAFRWEQGQHITLAGSSGSGKTTFARQLLPRRDYVAVMATKKRDKSLYEPLQEAGYDLTDHFDPYDRMTPRVIFRPRLSSPGREGLAEQAEAFGEALVGIFDAESWCVYSDEVRYLSEFLRLKPELETLWMQGRSLGISMVSGTQRPVSIPIIAFDSSHLFFWKTTDRRDIITMSEYTGVNRKTVESVLPRLPRHEALYVNTDTDELLRTKVRL